MEPLEPFERLEEDYYLGGRDGWYSDGENRDSESSDDDEFRKKISRLAGVRQECSLSHGKRQEKAQKKDEFESDMDDDLDEQFVAHASQFMVSTSSRASSSSATKEEGKAVEDGKAEQTDEEMPDLTSDSEEQPGVGKKESPLKDRSSGLLVSRPGTSQATPKRVTIKDEPDIIDDSSCSNRACGDGEKTRSAFDDEDNLLRKAAKKVKGDVAQAEDLPEFYDPDEDEDNELWVRQHRERLKIIPPRPEKASKKDGKDKDWEEDAKDYDDGKTDAVLSCPACMSLLTRDCQRHELYKNQYRAVFVENCNVITDKILFLPPTESKRSKKARKKKAAGPKPNEVVDPGDLSSIPKEDLFHPVQCSTCSLNVGVFDHDEIYHFFDVLTGYA